MPRTFISGANFSGRSAALRTRLLERGGFFLGPYAEAALSGLSSTVADEVDIYRDPAKGRNPAFAAIDWAACSRRKPATLSGGEQVLLALHCFSLSGFARSPSTPHSSSSMPSIAHPHSPISMTAKRSTCC